MIVLCPPSFVCPVNHQQVLMLIKEGARKRHPLSRPFGLSCASRSCRDVEKLASLRQFQRLFPPTAVMLSVKEWVFKKIFCHLKPIITLPNFEKIDGNSARTV
jgi:hypothetical protein